jgi:hypothetical protein
MFDHSLFQTFSKSFLRRKTIRYVVHLIAYLFVVLDKHISMPYFDKLKDYTAIRAYPKYADVITSHT